MVGRRSGYEEVELVPPSTDDNETSKLLRRVRWYAGPADVAVSGAGTVEHRKGASQGAASTLRRRRRPLLLVHRLPASGLQLRDATRARVIDESASGKTAIVTSARLSYADLLSARARRSLESLAAQRQSALRSWLQPFRCSQVFATGPSIASVGPEHVRMTPGGVLRIACNSIVSNGDLMDTIRPHVLTFGDPAFHFGDSEYAEAFRADLLARMAVDNEMWVVVPEEFYPSLHDRFGQFDRMVPCRVGPPRRFDPARFETRSQLLRTGNILTSAMLPIASSVGGSVEIFGCDGRAPTDSGFWKHSSAAQYDTLYASVVARHTSFFRDTDYEDYYRTHCMRLDRMISAMEKRGIAVTARTPSFIPCLALRQA